MIKEHLFFLSIFESNQLFVCADNFVFQLMKLGFLHILQPLALIFHRFSRCFCPRELVRFVALGRAAPGSYIQISYASRDTFPSNRKLHVIWGGGHIIVILC